MWASHTPTMYIVAVCPRRFPSSCDNLSLSRSKLFLVPLPSVVLPPPLLSSLSPLLLPLLLAPPPPCVPWVAAPAVTQSPPASPTTARPPPTTTTLNLQPAPLLSTLLSPINIMRAWQAGELEILITH